MPTPSGSTYEADRHLIRRIIYENSTTEYYALAAPGTATTDGKWQIKQVTLDASGRVTAELFAGGNADYIHKFSDYLSLSYS